MDNSVMVIATELNMRIKATGTPRTKSSALPLEIQQNLSPRIKTKKPLPDCKDITWKTKITYYSIGLRKFSPVSILK